MKLVLVLALTIIVGCIRDVLCTHNCEVYQYAYGTTYYMSTCTYDCCGYSTYKYCCDDDDDEIDNGEMVGIIAGSVVGGLIFLGLMTSVIICIVCKVKSKGSRVGHVLSATQNSPYIVGQPSNNQGHLSTNQSSTQDTRHTDRHPVPHHQQYPQQQYQYQYQQQQYQYQQQQQPLGYNDAHSSQPPPPPFYNPPEPSAPPSDYHY